MSDVIAMPVMTEAQEQAWVTLLDLHEELPRGWTMVGGQMVHLWCAERGVVMIRPTDDADIVLDVRLEPTILLLFTAALRRRGFEAETAPSGIQHRWRRGSTVIDVLIRGSSAPLPRTVRALAAGALSRRRARRKPSTEQKWCRCG